MNLALGLRVAVVLAAVVPVSGHAWPEPPVPPRQERAEDYEAREVEGARIHVNRALAADRPETLERVLLHMRADLDEIVHFAPAPALPVLRTVEIWVEKDGTHETGRGGHGMCCHWSKDWLAANGVLGAKVGHVEIMNPDDFLNWRRDQPYMLFHEMAHALHWRLSSLDAEIASVYRHAMDAKLYDAVPRNSVPEGQTVWAYAAENDHEYFAELSEAYFALNDFSPFTRAQFRAHDPDGFELVRRVWGMAEARFRSAWSPREAGVAAPGGWGLPAAGPEPSVR